MIDQNDGTNAVLHLNHINASSVGKPHVIQQFITWKLQ